jgi:uncharacterized glyoxalase superfamily protein PhnB
MAQPDMIGMTVKDMPAALKFYRLLGLEIPSGMESEDHVEVITPNGYRLAWDTVSMMKTIHPDWEEPAGQRIGLAFKCASPAEVDELTRQLEQEGYTIYMQPWDALWGQRYAVVLDPDGNKVDLFAPM